LNANAQAPSQGEACHLRIDQGGGEAPICAGHLDPQRPPWV